MISDRHCCASRSEPDLPLLTDVIGPRRPGRDRGGLRRRSPLPQVPHPLGEVEVLKDRLRESLVDVPTDRDVIQRSVSQPIRSASGAELIGECGHVHLPHALVAAWHESRRRREADVVGGSRCTT